MFPIISKVIFRQCLIEAETSCSRLKLALFLIIINSEIAINPNNLWQIVMTVCLPYNLMTEILALQAVSYHKIMNIKNQKKENIERYFELS